MKYFLGLVDRDGAIVARAENIELHAHGEGTRVLDRNVPGLGVKGSAVRVPSPLEDPTAAEGDPFAGISIAVLCKADNGGGEEETHVLPIGMAAGSGALALADKVSDLDAHVTELKRQLDAARGDTAAQLAERDAKLKDFEARVAALGAAPAVQS